MSSEEQDIQFGRYLLRRRLGSGGMAEVYLAEMTGTAGFQRLVALKRILPHLGDDEEFIDSFISEARLGGSLNHPNIVQTLELGREAGQYFLAMEFVDGMTLAQLLRARRERGEGLPLSLAIEIGTKLCEALSYAHTATDVRGNPLHMIHRDLKPDNVLLGRHGEVKLTDFGVAKASTSRRQTMDTSIVKGTVAYMSPEQAQGWELDPRSDLYSLGAILFELVTLEPLYPDAKGFPGLFMVQKGEVQPRLKLLDHYPAPFVATLHKLLQLEREGRHNTAQELRFELVSLQPLMPSSLFTLGDVVQQAIQAREVKRQESWALPLSGGSDQTLRPNPGHDAPEMQVPTSPRQPSNPSHPSLGRLSTHMSARAPETPRPASGGFKPPPAATLVLNPVRPGEIGAQSGALSGAPSGLPSGSPSGSQHTFTPNPLQQNGNPAGGGYGAGGQGLNPALQPGAQAAASATQGNRPVSLMGVPTFPSQSSVPSMAPPVASGGGAGAAGSNPAFASTSRPQSAPFSSLDDERTETGQTAPLRSATPGPAPAPASPARAVQSNTPLIAVGGVVLLLIGFLGYQLTRERTEVIGDPTAQDSAQSGNQNATTVASTGAAPSTASGTEANTAQAGAAQPGATQAGAAQAGAAQTPVQKPPVEKPVQKPPTEKPPVEKPVQKPPVEKPDEKPKPPPKLIAKPGYVTVNSRPFSYVSANGKSLGETPLRRAELPAGRYTLTFKTEEGQTQKVQVEIKPGEETKLDPVMF